MAGAKGRGQRSVGGAWGGAERRSTLYGVRPTAPLECGDGGGGGGDGV